VVGIGRQCRNVSSDVEDSGGRPDLLDEQGDALAVGQVPDLVAQRLE